MNISGIIVLAHNFFHRLGPRKNKYGNTRRFWIIRTILSGRSFVGFSNRRIILCMCESFVLFWEINK